MTAKLAGTTIAKVGFSNVRFLDFYSKSCQSGHDNIADNSTVPVTPRKRTSVRYSEIRSNGPGADCLLLCVDR